MLQGCMLTVYSMASSTSWQQHFTSTLLEPSKKSLSGSSQWTTIQLGKGWNCT
jgi:hypothetical protein